MRIVSREKKRLTSFAEPRLALLERSGGKLLRTLSYMQLGQFLQRDPDQRLYALTNLMLG